MDLAQRAIRLFDDSFAVQAATRDALAPAIAAAAELLTGSLLADGRILACGVGPGAPLAQGFAAALIDRYETERQELAACAIGIDASLIGGGAATATARQVAALGRPGDVLVAVGHDADDVVLGSAIRAARSQGLSLILLCAVPPADGLAEGDILLAVPDSRPRRVQEAQLLILNCLCDGIDALLLGVEP